MERRCLADINGPFYNPNKPFRNWSSFPFYQIDCDEPPYVDRAQLAWGIARAEEHLKHLYAQGYTGIVIDNLAHLVEFTHAPVPLYPVDSPYRQRSQIYRAAFARLFDAAVALGMEIFVSTDMQWSTPPVQAYVGRLTASNPRLAEVNRWALNELFTYFPQVRGLVVRIGETGGAHNQGTAYTGHMLYTTADRLRQLIDTLLPVCEQHDRLLIMRTWTIGIGELGDLLWSPSRYQSVFGDYRSPHLLVSIKHGPADFFRFLPPNPTLGQPGPAQIIELQNRREYELFGMVPSSVAALHQEVLRHAHVTNPRCAGVWAWNSSGGWGGGQAVLGDDGWSVWTELSSAVTAALAQTPDLDTASFVQAWCAQTFGAALGLAVADLYLESAELLERAWYIAQPTQDERHLGGVYLPPLLWVWWMRPTASPVVWAYLASLVTDPAQVEQESAAACARLAWHRERIAKLASAMNAQANDVLASVTYFHDVLATAQAIRTLMLRLFAAARNHQPSRWRRIAREAAQVRQRIQAHQARWGARADLPPLELAEMETFLVALERTPHRLWYQAQIACWLVARLHTRRKLPWRMRDPAALAVAILVVALFYDGHPRAGTASALASMLLVKPLRQRLVRLLVPWLNRRFHLLPSIFFETGPSITEWTA